ncbi:MAG: helix-turn-helix domain-containing protein [Lachnospiraceae bacterium]|nr:helix-turn-helix domain-containing protein [Lachnospiraceae bacterium]
MANNLGANIKSFRKNKGFTQEELAGMIGVTPQAVSRWESEAGLPDVSMIVPIAQTLGITTDALLGYQQQSQDDRITQKIFEKMAELEDVSDPGGSKLKICEYLAEEVGKNPMNYDMVVKYVQRVAGLSYYTDMEKLLADEPERAQSILTDGIRKGLNIIRYCSDAKKVNKAHFSLAWIYIHMKDFDNAREHVNVLPSLGGHCIREDLNLSLSFFEKGYDAMKDSAVELATLVFELIARQTEKMTTFSCYFGTLEEAIEICDWCESVIDAYSSKSGFFSKDTRNWALRKLNFSKMSAYVRAGDNAKAEETRENYLKQIKEEGLFADEELKSVIKEFTEGIYIL